MRVAHHVGMVQNMCTAGLSDNAVVSCFCHKNRGAWSIVNAMMEWLNALSEMRGVCIFFNICCGIHFFTRENVCNGFIT